MSNDLQLIPTKDEMQTYERIADQASKSGFFGKLGGTAGIFSIALYARELGQPPMQMLCGGMHNIMGKIEIAPVTMNAMIRKAGHVLQIIESSDTKCTIKGVRSDSKEEYTCTYSIDDAKRAGLFKAGSGWEKFPSDMLFARCLSRIARRLFPDVIGPSYVEGEIKETAEVLEPKKSAEAKKDVEIVESAPVEKAADPLDQLINPDDAKMIEDSLVANPEILEKILKAYKIDSISKMKVRDLPIVKQRLQDIFDEMDSKN